MYSSNVKGNSVAWDHVSICVESTIGLKWFCFALSHRDFLDLSALSVFSDIVMGHAKPLEYYIDYHMCGCGGSI